MISREEALAAILEPSSVERLRGARALAKSATHDDREALTRARRTEPDMWVRSALDQALARIDPRKRNSRPEHVTGGVDRDEQRLLSDVRAQATEEVTKALLHELGPLVGFIRRAASREVAPFPGSETEQAIERLQAFLRAMRSLQEASSAPDLEEVNLTELILHVVAENPKPDRVEIRCARDDQVIVIADPALLRLAIANAIRNAIEACQQQVPRRDGHVVINWGITDRDAWVAILDDGCGLPEGWDKAWVPGTTTKSKKEHFGMGLSNARSAIRSLGGTIRLRPQDGGTACELRWSCEAE